MNSFSVRKFVPVCAALAGLVLGQANIAQAAALKINSPAPPMKIAKWVKGTPVTAFAKGRIYVVEFWATWCGPCKQSIPHLTELAKKYKGKVTFTGVDISEVEPGTKSTAYFTKVASFVKDMGAKMDYNVGVDGPDASMSHTWMDAAGQSGIPTAFVVGKEGKIVWIGHPMAGLDEALGQIIAGKFDSKAYAASVEKANVEQDKAAAESEKLQKLFGHSVELYSKGDYKSALVELNKTLAANPQYEKQAAMFKYNVLLKADEKEAYAYARKMADGDFKNNAQALASIAHTIVDDNAKLAAPDYDTAVTLAQRANELTKNENPLVLDTLATAYFKKGDSARAVEFEDKAIAVAAKTPGVPDQFKTQLNTHLAQYKKK